MWSIITGFFAKVSGRLVLLLGSGVILILSILKILSGARQAGRDAERTKALERSSKIQQKQKEIIQDKPKSKRDIVDRIRKNGGF